MKKVIVITGPTASGKTAVSVELAGRINGEIINCDSMQIYKGCDIGSAKPSTDEMKGISHHLIDITDPMDSFSAAEYKSMATAKIEEILARGNVPVLTGGTGLYIDALVKNMDFDGFKGNPGVRDRLNELLKEKGPEYMYGLLLSRDAEAAGSVHPNNTRRVIRYLEILDGFEGTLAEYMNQAVSKPAEYDFKIFVLWPERDFVYKRIEKRVDSMLKAGLVYEVRRLYDSGVHADSQAMMGIGYKETLSFVAGNSEYDDFVEILKRNTRRYAKRQFTWLKRYGDAEFLTVDGNSTAEGLADTIYSLINA